MPWIVIWLGVLVFGYLTDLDSDQVFYNLFSPVACVGFVLIGLSKLLGSGGGYGGHGGSGDGGFWGGGGDCGGGGGD